MAVENETDKKDIAATYAYRTFWACMRMPVFMRVPFAVVAGACFAVKLVEHTIEHVQDQKTRPELGPTDGTDPFAGAFTEE